MITDKSLIAIIIKRVDKVALDVCFGFYGQKT